MTTRSSRSASPAATGAALRRVDLQLKKCEQVRLRIDVTLIVAGVFLRENADGRTEALLIQEAAKKCRGQWFLPAGRVEPGETIEAAVKREVEEEAGVKCDVKQLISMNVSDGNWYRMAFYCNVTGGQPKTTADKESLQAQWHDVDAIKGGHLKLRGTDIFRLIDEAVRYRGWRTAVPPVLNVDEPQQGLFIELVLVKRDSNGQPREVLVHSSVTSEADVTTRIDPFPVVSFYHKTKGGFTDAISKLYDHLLEDGQHAFDTPSELLATWCLPSPADSVWNGGLRVRVLGRLRTPSNDARIKNPALFRWQALSDANIVALNLHKDAFRARLFL